MYIFCHQVLVFLCENAGELERVAALASAGGNGSKPRARFYLHADVIIINYPSSATEVDLDLASIQEAVVQMRLVAFPQPPSQILIDVSDYNATEKQKQDTAIKPPTLPIIATAVAVGNEAKKSWTTISIYVETYNVLYYFIVGMVWYFPKIANVITFDPIVPVINAVAILLVLYMCYKHYILK